MQKNNNVIVTNVYKNGIGTTKEKYTQIWIRLINSKERGKIIVSSPGR